MDDRQKALEFKVGLFVFIGLSVIAAMVAKFGKIGQGFSNFYSLTIEFPDSGGLIRNSDVLLAGARIGYVEERPAIRDDMSGVKVALKIQEGTKIPRATTFKVDSSGLLGDKFVKVIPLEGFDPAKFDPNDPKQVFQPGETIPGLETAGLAQLQKKGEDVLDALKAELEELKKATDTLNTKILTEENTGHLSTTFANLRKTSENFSDASVKIKGVIDNAQTAVDSAKKTMTTTESAAADLKLALADARKVMEGAKTLVNNATGGKGAIATLLNDPQFSENLKALVSNMRERGVLFYRDVADETKKPAPKPAPRRR